MGADIRELIEQIRAGLDHRSGLIGDLEAHNFDDAVEAFRRLLEHIAELEARTDSATVTISRMGWDDDGKFTATAVFAEPPGWPVAVVWNSLPVRMSLPSSPGGRE